VAFQILFSVFGSVLFRRDEVVGDLLRGEEIHKGRRFFIVEDLNFKFVSEVAKKMVGE
jgi:hypothetical protein